MHFKQVVFFLIEKRARYDNQKYHDQSIFLYAYEHNKRKFITYILKKENISQPIDKLFANTPLHFACYLGHVAIIQYLIEKGANLKAKDYQQKTPLHKACGNGYLQIVQYLIE